MRWFILCLALAGCKNEAISYAKLINPKAKCNAIQTSWAGDGIKDTAVCTFSKSDGVHVWACVGGSQPECREVANYQAEEK